MYICHIQNHLSGGSGEASIENRKSFYLHRTFFTLTHLGSRIATRHGTLLLSPPCGGRRRPQGVGPPSGPNTLLKKQDGGTTVNN
jgi:hypothetical protein